MSSEVACAVVCCAAIECIPTSSGGWDDSRCTLLLGGLSGTDIRILSEPPFNGDKFTGYLAGAIGKEVETLEMEVVARLSWVSGLIEFECALFQSLAETHLIAWFDIEPMPCTWLLTLPCFKIHYWYPFIEIILSWQRLWLRLDLDCLRLDEPGYWQHRAILCRRSWPSSVTK